MKKIVEEKPIKEIDYNIFNALNLINPALGEAYASKGYNPFDDEFVLQNNYVKKLLHNAKEKENIVAESFLEKGNKEVANIFARALVNTKEVLSGLENSNVKNDNIKEVIVFLKNRQELLSQAIVKLQDANADIFALYKDIVGIDTFYSEIIKNTFFKNFNQLAIVENFLRLCQSQNEVEEEERIAREHFNNAQQENEKENFIQELSDLKKETAQENIVKEKSFEEKNASKNEKENIEKNVEQNKKVEKEIVEEQPQLEQQQEVNESEFSFDYESQNSQNNELAEVQEQGQNNEVFEPQKPSQNNEEFTM